MSLREAVFLLLCVNYFVNYLNTHTATHAHSHWHTHFALKRLFPYIYDVCKYIAYRLFIIFLFAQLQFQIAAAKVRN